jgi:hypothetical protein
MLTVPTSPGATITGSATQVAVCSGSGNAAGSANLTFGSGVFAGIGTTFQMGDIGGLLGSATVLQIADSSGAFAFDTAAGSQPYFHFYGAAGTVTINNTNGTIDLGDFEGNNNGIRLLIDDTDAVQQVSMGDLYAISTGAVLAVDVLNGKVTSSVKIVSTGDVIVNDTAKGLVLKSPDGHYWRATISNLGVLSAWADLGTSLP